MEQPTRKPFSEMSLAEIQEQSKLSANAQPSRCKIKNQSDKDLTRPQTGIKLNRADRADREFSEAASLLNGTAYKLYRCNANHYQIKHCIYPQQHLNLWITTGTVRASHAPQVKRSIPFIKLPGEWGLIDVVKAFISQFLAKAQPCTTKTFDPLSKPSCSASSVQDKSDQSTAQRTEESEHPKNVRAGTPSTGEKSSRSIASHLPPTIRDAQASDDDDVNVLSDSPHGFEKLSGCDLWPLPDGDENKIEPV